MHQAWEQKFKEKLAAEQGSVIDPAHDLAHFERVVATAKALAREEGGDLAVVVPAAWLHDLVNVPKHDPRRAQASRLSARAATAWLREIGYPAGHLEGIAHAIEAHSFSAGIAARTLEAKIVQDADRLDAAGAIGVARCFSVGALLGQPIYRTLDHFHEKLFKIMETLQTEAGRREGQRRTETMRAFLRELGRERGSPVLE
jgi:uncharacterized protein